MHPHRLFFVCLLSLFVAKMAFAQDVEVPTAEVAVDWATRIEVGLLTWLPRVMALASVITAIFPSSGTVMRVIDAFAMSWGRARNDPASQNWSN